MNLKLSPELFLEKAELTILVESLKKYGFVLDKQMSTEEFGIVKNSFIDPNFDYFKIIATADNNKFRIREGWAYDKDRLTIHYKYATEDIVIPLPGQSYWVKVSHKYESREIGTVSIGGMNQGLMNGIGTEFTKVLRGQPNFPAKIKFLNSLYYNLEYEVLEVLDDQNANIQGLFDLPESDLKYSVYGTFTPGYNPPSGDEEIFQYDSCQVDLIVDTGVMPSLTQYKEFIIGKVSYTNSGIVIQDYRFSCPFKSSDRVHVDSISEQNNKLSGIESIKKIAPIANSVGFYNIAFDWKFNILSETQNSVLSQIAITSGSGGVWKDTSPFATGDFDGWRYYYSDGNYSNILTSTKTGSIILLSVDSVRIGSGAGVCITPNAEEVEIYAEFRNTGDTATVHKKIEYFGIAMTNPVIYINDSDLISSNQSIRLYTVFKNHFRRTQKNQFNVSVYFNELAFNSSGALTDATKITTSSVGVLQNTVSPVFIHVPLKVPLPWYPSSTSEINSNFSIAGIGTSTQFLGWAVCNGLNSTPDLRGKFIVGAINNVPNSGAPALPTNVDPTLSNPNYSVGSEGGTTKEILTLSQIPTHKHDVSVSVAPHTHGYNDRYPSTTNGGSDPGGWANTHTIDHHNDSMTTTSASPAATVTESDKGGGQSHNNLPPYFSLIYIMRIQ